MFSSRLRISRVGVVVSPMPLMAAARDGFTEIVRNLLVAGADYRQVDEFGRTVSHTLGSCLCTASSHIVEIQADSVAKEKGFDETSDVVLKWAAEHEDKS